MATTPEGLWYPSGTDNINPLHPVLAAMQTSVGANPRVNTPAGVHKVANDTELTTLVTNLTTAGYVISAANPAFVYRTDTKRLMVNEGAGWVIYSNTLQFATTGDRDAAIPLAARKVGMVAVVDTGTAMAVTVWNGSAWIYPNTLQFATTGDRDAAIPLADRTVGMVAVVDTGTAMAVTVWNGSAWIGSAWEPHWADTGWVAPTLAAGFTGGDFGYRLRGGVVYFRGSVTRTAGNFPASNTSILLNPLPAEVRPAQESRFPLTTLASSTARGAECIVSAAGTINVYSTGAGTNTVRFNPVVYPVG